MRNQNNLVRPKGVALLLERLRLPPTSRGNLGANKVLQFGLGLGVQESPTGNEKHLSPFSVH